MRRITTMLLLARLHVIIDFQGFSYLSFKEPRDIMSLILICSGSQFHDTMCFCI